MVKFYKRRRAPSAPTKSEKSCFHCFAFLVVRACANLCSHQRQIHTMLFMLEQGRLERTAVPCSAHWAIYDFDDTRNFRPKEVSRISHLRWINASRCLRVQSQYMSKSCPDWSGSGQVSLEDMVQSGTPWRLRHWAILICKNAHAALDRRKKTRSPSQGAASWQPDPSGNHIWRLLQRLLPCLTAGDNSIFFFIVPNCLRYKL